MHFLPLAGVIASVVLAGCASTASIQLAPAAIPQTADCRTWYRTLDAAIDESGVRDAGEARLAGLPHLRADRFSASFVDAARGDAAVARTLHERLRVNGIAAHTHEIRNLPAAWRHRFAIGDGHTALARLQACSALLASDDLRQSEQHAAWLNVLAVPDRYTAWKRVLGLYPLTSVAFFGGIEQWQRETEADFLAASRGFTGTRYRAATPVAIAPDPQDFRSRSRDPLGIPHFSPDEWRALLARHAPVIEIEQRGAFDHPGALVHGINGVAVDNAHPVAYQRIAYTRLAGRTLIQLVYAFWFSERPQRHPLDLLAGSLDGVMIRITLDEYGAPLLVDSIHACGCYHVFMPGERLAVQPPPEKGIEWAFIPQRLPLIRPGEHLAVRLASGTHYIVGLYAIPATGTGDRTYQLADEHSLRSLPSPSGGNRSVYDVDGFIAGSERGERLWFWPMGIASPGAMRQWGHHATAFVGRRHFDDADLIDKRFSLLPRN